MYNISSWHSKSQKKKVCLQPKSYKLQEKPAGTDSLTFISVYIISMQGVIWGFWVCLLHIHMASYTQRNNFLPAALYYLILQPLTVKNVPLCDGVFQKEKATAEHVTILFPNFRTRL